jgi:hypothetical protein
VRCLKLTGKLGSWQPCGSCQEGGASHSGDSTPALPALDGGAAEGAGGDSASHLTPLLTPTAVDSCLVEEAARLEGAGGSPVAGFEGGQAQDCRGTTADQLEVQGPAVVQLSVGQEVDLLLFDLRASPEAAGHFAQFAAAGESL